MKIIPRVELFFTVLLTISVFIVILTSNNILAADMILNSTNQTCNNDSDCESTFCINGICGPELGQWCDVYGEDSSCPSGYCGQVNIIYGEDNLCCDSICDQPCMSCNIPGREGHCEYVPEGTEDSRYCDTYPYGCSSGLCTANHTCGFKPFGAGCEHFTYCDMMNRSSEFDIFSMPVGLCNGAGDCIPFGCPVCGNGVVQPGWASSGLGIYPYGEACDDGNLINGDGCSDKCIVESGYTCTGLFVDPSICALIPVCGNGIIQSGEQCDAGENNSVVCSPPSQGSCTYCSANCSIITVNDLYCGDNIINNAEKCELPSTNDNSYCTQSATGSCNSTRLGVRDTLGNCNDTCGCVLDSFSFVCVKDQCGAKCDDSSDCDDGNTNTKDTCLDNCTCINENVPHCGDTIVNNDEECDGSNLDGKTCTSLGYSKGTLSCSESCNFIKTGCTKKRSRGGGGGGGGGGSASTQTWNCSDWSDCVNGEQTQECTQVGSLSSKKTNTRNCTVAAVVAELEEVKPVEQTNFAEENNSVKQTNLSVQDVAESPSEAEGISENPEMLPEAPAITGAVVGSVENEKPAWGLMLIIAGIVMALALVTLKGTLLKKGKGKKGKKKPVTLKD